MEFVIVNAYEEIKDILIMFFRTCLLSFNVFVLQVSSKYTNNKKPCIVRLLGIHLLSNTTHNLKGKYNNYPQQ